MAAKGFSEDPPRQSFVRVKRLLRLQPRPHPPPRCRRGGTMADPPGKVQQTASSLTALAVHSCIPFSFLQRTLFPRRRTRMALVRHHQRRRRQRDTVYPTVFFAALHCCGPCRGTSVHCALRPICTVPRQTIHNFFLTFCFTSPRHFATRRPMQTCPPTTEAMLPFVQHHCPRSRRYDRFGAARRDSCLLANLQHPPLAPTLPRGEEGFTDCVFFGFALGFVS